MESAAKIPIKLYQNRTGKTKGFGSIFETLTFVFLFAFVTSKVATLPQLDLSNFGFLTRKGKERLDGIF